MRSTRAIESAWAAGQGAAVSTPVRLGDQPEAGGRLARGVLFVGDRAGEAIAGADGQRALGAVANHAAAEAESGLVVEPVLGDAQRLIDDEAAATFRLLGDAEHLVEAALVVLVSPRHR